MTVNGKQIGIALALTSPDGSGRARGFRDLLRDVREAEDLGFDSVWVADHLLIEQGPDKYRDMPEPTTLIGALASATSRIRLGTLVLCQSFRHPGLLAKSAATLAEISGGRFILGLGAGWHEPEYRAFGLPFADRVSRLSEYLRVLTDLFREGHSNFQGQYFQTRDARLLARSVPPIWVAARGPRMMDVTAQFADGWNTAWHGEEQEGFYRQRTSIAASRERLGRAGGFETSVGVLVVPVRDEQQSREIWARLTSLSSLEPHDEHGLRRRVVVAAPERTAGILAAYWDAGADHIIVSPGAAPFSSWEPDSIRVLGKNVLPLLR